MAEYQMYDFQKQSVAQLLGGKHIIISTTGSGKSAMAMRYLEERAKQTGKQKFLIVTTASKSRAVNSEGLNDFEADARIFCSLSFYESLSSSLSLISWHKLRAWVDANWRSLEDYIFIFDECLPADTKVKTQCGEKEIADLAVGDNVLSYNHDTHKLEYKKITRTIKKPSPNKMIRLRLADGTAIISTGNHPHYTQDGYKNAEDIKKGDTLYEMWNMRNRDRQNDIDKITKRQDKDREEDILLGGMREGGDKRKRKKSDGEQRAEREIAQDGDKKNGGEQLFQGQETYREGVGYQKRAGMATDMDKTPRIKGWQRKIYRTPKIIMGKTKQSKQRMGDGTACIARGMDKRLPKELQVRYRERILQNRYRVRWGWAQRRQSESQGQKKREEIRGVRVESVEILERGDIKRLGLYRDADNVYCIDVEDNHNFFANGVLTHNCQKAGAGVSSGMGRAFLKIAKRNQDWVGFTATPGDTWLKFYPYMVACGLEWNKTSFMRKYANVQTFKGYPEIVGWRNESELRDKWARISYAPDTSKVMAELPPETHKVVEFKKPPVYGKILKTRYTEDGELLDTSGALCAELRRLCFTKEKQEWVKEFVEGLGTRAVMFYNFIKTGDELEKIITKALPKGARVWRIDGKHHEIPTAETIGDYDVVLCQWQSGSEGLNLQHTNYMVIVEACYSYSTSIQGRGRIRRIGQTKPQFYYYLKTLGTIEEAVYKALRTKSDFAEDVWCLENNLIEEE